jgi:hypothetical protein
MNERVLGKILLWPVIIILVAILGIAVTPGLAAEPSYNLQQLFDGQSIQIDNLKFENFTPGSNTLHDASDYEKISVEKLGAGTLNPGLKFVPDPDSSPPIWSSKARGTKYLYFSYEVNTVDGSSSITGFGLILDPGILESSSGTASATVRDGKLEVKRELYWLPFGGPQAVAERLEDISTLSGTATVYPNISVILYFKNEGDQASIESFEQRFSLAPAPGAPTANAGPDLIVADVVNLDGSKSKDSDGQIMSYVWKLKYRENSTFDREAKEPTPEISDLEPGFYDVELTVTDDDGYTATDTMLLAASGPSGVGTYPKAELNLWRFKLKKYKYCNWSIARMLGTFDLPDDFEFNRGDDLVGKVTIQVNRGEEPLVVMSDDIKLKVRKWKYKSEIYSY